MHNFPEQLNSTSRGFAHGRRSMDVSTRYYTHRYRVRFVTHIREVYATDWHFEWLFPEHVCQEGGLNYKWLTSLPPFLSCSSISGFI